MNFPLRRGGSLKAQCLTFSLSALHDYTAHLIVALAVTGRLGGGKVHVRLWHPQLVVDAVEAELFVRARAKLSKVLRHFATVDGPFS